MKKPVLTAQDKTRLLIACVELPALYNHVLRKDYMHDLMVTVLDFYMRTEAVIKSLVYFEKVQTQQDIHTHARLSEVLLGFADSREGDVQASQFLWSTNHWKRARLLRRLLAYLESVGVTDQPSLDAWARQADFERDFKGKAPGLGLAVFQWLIIRCGVQTVKPDVWVFRFSQRVLGRKISDKVAVALFNELAPMIGTSISAIDATIWSFERTGMAQRDAPALRIVFWQQLKKRLEARISGDKHLQAGHWSIQIDHPTRLRYDQAGLRMSGRLRLHGESRRVTTRVEVTQSSWQERFEVRLTVRRDKPLKDAVWAGLQSLLKEAGWALGNDPAFDAAFAFNIDLIMAPDLSIEALVARVEDMVGKTVTEIRAVSSGPVVVPETKTE